MNAHSAADGAVRKVLLLDTGTEWGGGTNSMYELLKRIDQRRFKIVCCFYKNYSRGNDGRQLSDELADIGIEFLLLPIKPRPRWAKFLKEFFRGVFFWSKDLKYRATFAIDLVWRIWPRARAIAALLRDGRFDILYMNNSPSSNLEGYLAGEMAGIPVVQHCRSEPLLHRYELKVVNRVAACLICVSPSVAEILREQGVASEKLRVVFNAIDTDLVFPSRAELLPQPEGLVIGTVGRLTALKSIGHLLEAVARLKLAGIPCTCLLIGEGGGRKALEEQAGRLGISDRIRFLGFQSEPLSWIQLMDVCVLCSSKEGLPRVVLEAMLTKKPVIGSKVTGTKDLVVDGETGILYPYGDIDRLVAALEELAGSADRREWLGLNGYRLVCQKFSITTYVEGVVSCLDAV